MLDGLGFHEPGPDDRTDDSRLIEVTVPAGSGPRLVGTPTTPRARTQYTYSVTSAFNIVVLFSRDGTTRDGPFIEVVANTAPTATGTIDPVTGTAGDPAVTRDVASHFSDTDAAAGDMLTYTAASDDEAVATASVSGSVVTVTPVGAGSATVTVTATDLASQTATRTIAVTVMAPPGTDATLSALSLSVGALTPVFAADTTAYTATVTNDIAILTVTPTAADDGASVAVNGNRVTSGMPSGAIDLSVGATTITIVVTAEDGTTTETYTVTVTVTDGVAEIAARSGRVGEAVLPHVAQAVASGVLSAIAGRIDAAISGASPSGISSLAGNSDPLDALRSGTRQDGAGGFDLERALGGSSFLMPLGAAADGGAGTGDIALWGSGDWRNLSGPDDSAVSWDGDLSGFHLGTDVRLRSDLLAGMSVSHSSGSFDYTDRGGAAPAKGTYDTRMTAVHPYASWSSARDARLWATVGYGQGEIEIREAGQAGHSADTSMWMAAAGASGRLLSGAGVPGGGAATLRVKAEGAVARVDVDGSQAIRSARYDARQLRVALEGGWECAAGAAGGCLAPSLEAGLRHAGGDARAGGGFEIGGALRYRSAGLTVEGRGRAW